MADLKRFRDLVTKYRKPYQQVELEKAITLPAGELSHRLNGTGRQPLTRTNVLDIVVMLTQWQGVKWEEAVELLEIMDYPLDTLEWKRRLQEHITPPDLSFPAKGSPGGVASAIPERMLLQPRRLFQARDLPKGYIPRPQSFDEIKRLLLTYKGNQTTAITAALRGAGGFGKTTLALALCHDPEVQAAFPDGIWWIQLGEQSPEPLDLLNRLLAASEDAHTDAILLQEAQERWHLVLRDRACLLVIDDVWQHEALSPLLQGGARCRHLVTTRNDLLLPKEIPLEARFLVDAMEPQEAMTLLCQDLPEEVSQLIYQPQLEALVACLGRWPLLLTLANGMLVDRVVYHHATMAEALKDLIEAYETYGVTAFRLDNLAERQRTVDACLSVSLQYLEKQFSRSRSHATERYQELVVFPGDTDIPLATLQVYWKGSAGLRPWETKDLCICLHRLSLLLTCDLGTGMICLHGVMHSYLIQHAGEQMPTLHQRLLDAYQQHYHLSRWADLPQSEVYLWQRLVFHLCQAGNQEALQTTLTDLWYVTRALQYRGVSALEDDLVSATTAPLSKESGKSLLQLASLHQRIRGFHHLLQQVSSEAQIGGLLLSALHKEENLMIQRQILEQELPRPFLTIWHSSLSTSSYALFRTLWGHTDLVRSCGFSPDSRWVVSASWDGTLKVWEVATGAEWRTLRGHTKAVVACEFSPDGKWIASASLDGTLKVWDATTGIALRTLRGHTKGFRACGFSPDSKWIVSSSFDMEETLQVWDVATGAEVHTPFGYYTGGAFACGFSPDGKWIVSTYVGGLTVWEAATGAEQYTLRGHTGAVYAFAFSPDGKWIVSACGHPDPTLKIWEAATGAEQHTLRGHTSGVVACGFSPDGKWIVSSSSDCTLKVWEAATGAEQHTLRGHTDVVTACGFSPDGKWIVSASDDQTVKVWEAVTEAKERTLRGHTKSVFACGFSPDGKWIVSASADHTLKVWDTATGAEQRTIGYTSWVTDCGYSPDGKWIVSASPDSTLKVWDSSTGAEVRTLKGHSDWVGACVFSSDGRWIVSASWDGTLKVWFAFAEVYWRTLIGHTDAVYGCAVSPDSQWIVSTSRDGTLKVWGALTGSDLLTLRGHTGAVNACAVSADGRWIVSASSDSTLKVWGSSTGAEVRTLIGHTDAVNACTFNPNGRLIVSGCEDGTLKVWEMQSGQCLLTFPTGDALSDCAFHPDGEHLVACGQEGMYFLRLMQ